MAHAEDAYVFQHAIVRDAAYSLQLPGHRANLHKLAIDVMESMHGRPPRPAFHDDQRATTHPIDPWAFELAEHARQAGLAEAADAAALQQVAALYLHRAADYAMSHYRNHEATRAWEALAATSAGDDLAACLGNAASVHERLGAMVQALAMRRRAIGHASPRNAGRARVELASTLRQMGRLAEAAAEFESALASIRVGGNAEDEGRALAAFAVLRKVEGRVKESEDAFVQALSIQRACGDRASESATLANLANLYLETGRVREAEDAYLAALDLTRRLGSPHGEPVVLNNLGTLYRDTGRRAQAEQAYATALKQHRELGLRRSEAISLANLSGMYEEDGKLDQSLQAMNQALEIFREIGDRINESIYLGNLAGIHQAARRPAQAEAALRSALALSRAIANRRTEGVLLGNLASLLSQTGSAEVAGLYAAALAIHREVGNRRFEGLHLCSQSEFLYLSGREADARASWDEGLAILHQLNDPLAPGRKRATFRQACARASVAPPAWID